MSKLTPKQAQEKHARRLKGATDDIRLGVDRVTEAPGIKAAEKQDKMRQNIMAAIDSGKWADRVASVPLSEWKDKMKVKGIPRIAAGIDGAAAKTEEFFSQLFDHQDRLQAEISGMPDLTLEDSISRMTAFVRGMAKFERR